MQGYRKAEHPVQVTVHDKNGRLKAVRRTHNLRTNVGGTWQANLMMGSTVMGYQGTATATSATSLTDTSAAWTTNEWAGFCVGAAGTTYGSIVSNTATVLTIDKWYAPATPGGAAAATPAATASFEIRGLAPAWWLGVTTTAVSPSSTDTTLSGELTANGFARAFAGGPLASGTGVALTSPTATASTTQTFSYTEGVQFTATGSETGIQAAALFTADSTTAGGIMVFENTFSSVNVISGDVLTVTWTITG